MAPIKVRGGSPPSNTHETMIFELLIRIAVTAFGGLPNSLALQLQFPCFSNRMQLQEITPLRDFQSFSAITLTWFNCFRL